MSLENKFFILFSKLKLPMNIFESNIKQKYEKEWELYSSHSFSTVFQYVWISNRKSYFYFKEKDKKS